MADQRIQYILTATDRTSSAFASVRSSLGTLGNSVKAFSGAFAALGAVGSVAGIATAFKGAIDQLAALDDAAEQTGASVESLSSLLNTLAPTGVGLEQITDLATKLVRSMGEASSATSNAGRAFRAIGVETRDASGNLRSVDDVLVDIAKALAQYEDGTNKAALAQALLGRSGAQYLPLLKDLATRQREAATVTGDTAARAEELANAWRALSFEGTKLSQSVFAPVIVALAEITKRFADAKTAGLGFFDAIQGSTLPDSRVTDEIGKQRKAIEQLQAARKAEQQSRLQNPGMQDDGALAAIDAEIETRRRAIDFLQGRANALDKGRIKAAAETDPELARLLRGRPLLASPVVGSENAAGAATRGQSEAQRLLESLRNQLAGVEDLSEAEKVLDKIRRGAVEGLTPALRDQILAQATLIDLAKDAEEADKRRVDGIKKQEQATKDLQKAIDDLAESEAIEADTKRDALNPELAKAADLQIRAWKQYKDLVAESVVEQQKLTQAVSDVIGKQLELGNIAPETADALRNQLLGAGDAAKETKTGFEDLGLTFASAFEDAIVNGAKLSDVLRGIADDLVRLVVRRSIVEPLAGGISTFLSGIIPGRASGGPVSAGRPYMVGEVGKELFVPRTDGYIVPNGGLGGVAITQNISVGAGVNRAEVAAAMYAAKESAKAEILASMRRGSTFAAA